MVCATKYVLAFTGPYIMFFMGQWRGEIMNELSQDKSIVTIFACPSYLRNGSGFISYFTDMGIILSHLNEFSQLY